MVTGGGTEWVVHRQGYSDVLWHTTWHHLLILNFSCSYCRKMRYTCFLASGVKLGAFLRPTWDHTNVLCTHSHAPYWTDQEMLLCMHLVFRLSLLTGLQIERQAAEAYLKILLQRQLAT